MPEMVRWGLVDLVRIETPDTQLGIAKAVLQGNWLPVAVRRLMSRLPRCCMNRFHLGGIKIQRSQLQHNRFLLGGIKIQRSQLQHNRFHLGGI